MGAAFAAAALAMTAASVDPETIKSESAVAIRCSGEDDEDLLYAWLNAVILEMATRAMAFGRFEVEIENGALRATAWGEEVSPERHHPAVELKGATYTALAVRREDGQWVAQCVVDV
jgi:tRNA nucleotidyltransferase (CCA-adding enzyme)